MNNNILPTSRFLAFAAACGLAGGCATGLSGSFPTDATARSASGTPLRFEPVDRAARLTPADTIAGNGCLNPMVDPRDNTQLRLVRAIAPRGDYAAPPGRYGARAGELLRLDCNTGRVIGVVAGGSGTGP